MAGLPPSFTSAVDLSSLKSPAPAANPVSAPGPSPFIVDIDEAMFESLMATSQSVPVVIDFWATWCGPCKQLSPILERLAVEGQGRWLLAKIDVDANQRLAQAFQIQSIPSVMALVAGQPVPLFQGAQPEAQVAAVIDQLLTLSAQNGVNGRLEGAAPAREVEEEADPDEERALVALESGDYSGAIAAYEALLARMPAHPYAATSIAQVRLMQRVDSVDAAQVRSTAAAAPDDVDAQIACADLDMSGGHVEDAFARLIDTVRRVDGPQRALVREHLIMLFGLLDPADVRVIKARTSLANALF